MKISELDRKLIICREEEIEEQIQTLLNEDVVHVLDLNGIMLYLGLFDEEVICSGECNTCQYNNGIDCIRLSHDHVRRVVRKALARKHSIEVML